MGTNDISIFEEKDSDIIITICLDISGQQCLAVFRIHELQVVTLGNKSLLSKDDETYNFHIKEFINGNWITNKIETGLPLSSHAVYMDNFKLIETSPNTNNELTEDVILNCLKEKQYLFPLSAIKSVYPENSHNNYLHVMFSEKGENFENLREPYYKRGKNIGIIYDSLVERLEKERIEKNEFNINKFRDSNSYNVTIITSHPKLPKLPEEVLRFLYSKMFDDKESQLLLIRTLPFRHQCTNEYILDELFIYQTDYLTLELEIKENSSSDDSTEYYGKSICCFDTYHQMITFIEQLKSVADLDWSNNKMDSYYQNCTRVKFRKLTEFKLKDLEKMLQIKFPVYYFEYN